MCPSSLLKREGLPRTQIHTSSLKCLGLNLPGCGDWAVFSITVDFGLDVYPFISQTSSRMFILAILLQPGASHTLPSGTLSASIPTVSAQSRDLGGSPDVAKPHEGRLTPPSILYARPPGGEKEVGGIFGEDPRGFNTKILFNG